MHDYSVTKALLISKITSATAQVLQIIRNKSMAQKTRVNPWIEQNDDQNLSLLVNAF